MESSIERVVRRSREFSGRPTFATYSAGDVPAALAQLAAQRKLGEDYGHCVAYGDSADVIEFWMYLPAVGRYSWPRETARVVVQVNR